MSGGSYSKTGSRKKTELIRRALVRRTSCIQLLWVNTIMFFFLVLAVHACVNFTLFSFQAISRDERDQYLLTKYKDSHDFFECPYQSPEKHDMIYCSDYCGEKSLITRVHRLDKSSGGWKRANRNFNKPANCANKLELFDCHESRTDNTCPGPRTDLLECGGMPGSKLYSSTDDHAAVTYGRKLTEEDLHKTYLANELIIHCPMCQITIKYTEKSTDCLLKVSTLEEGWPANYRYCPNVLDKGKGHTCEAISL